MTTVMTHGGKIGDCLLAWPVAYQWAKQNNKQVELWLDQGILKPLVPLFEAQSCVESVKLIPGIQHYGCGGQPFHFGLKTEDFVDREIFHLGMRSFPNGQITLQTLDWLPFDLDREALAKEPSLQVESTPKNRVVLHGTFRCNTGTPSFWRFLSQIREDLRAFDEIVFVGTQEERECALDLYPKWSAFDDHGSFLELAQLIAGSRLVIGSGSSGVVLAGCLKVPSIRVHDAIGDHPKCIWSSLGPNQHNETERDLRTLWPEIRESLMVAV